MKRTYKIPRTGNGNGQPEKAPDRSFLMYTNEDVELSLIIEGFIDSRRGLSPSTIKYYKEQLAYFQEFLKNKNITTINPITAKIIRDYLAYLEEKGLNAGGQSAAYRAIRALQYWWEKEMEGDYQAPIRKVEAPKVNTDPVPGITPEEIQQLVDSCCGENEKRDRAIFLVLFDTGVRAHELINLNISDVNFISGSVIVRHGKGDKSRMVFLGIKSKRALKTYLRRRGTVKPADPLFVKDDGERISYWTLKDMFYRRSKDAKLNGTPFLHDFRRAFALALWRNGTDIVTISRLMGHSSIEVLKRYLAQDEEDLAKAHAKSSPVDTKLK